MDLAVVNRLAVNGHVYVNDGGDEIVTLEDIDDIDAHLATSPLCDLGQVGQQGRDAREGAGQIVRTRHRPLDVGVEHGCEGVDVGGDHGLVHLPDEGRVLSHLVALDLRTEALSNNARDLAGIGVPTQVGLGEDQVAVESDLEPSARRRHQIDVLDDRRPPVQQFVRQTDGTRHVVSGNTELDAEVVTRVKHRKRGY
jgi:hypothetical protein